MRPRTAVAVTAVVLGSAGVAVPLLASSGTTAPRKPAAAEVTGPIDGNVHTVGLRTTGAKAGAPAQSTSPFSLLGVVWDRPGTRLRGTVKVRTRSATTGTWSAWRPVTVADDDVPDGTKRERSRQGTTAPLWVGPSNGVAVQVTGHRRLPAGLRAVLIDPGARRRRPARTGVRHPAHAAGHQGVRVALAADSGSPDPSAPPADSPSAAPTASTSVSPPQSPAPTTGPSDSPLPSASASPTPRTGTAPRPTIVSRAQWGADESLVATPNAYADQVKAVFVHHTDTGNDYSCADSAAVVRSIFLYHVKTNGWNDVGYNFLVDKCGTLFEGRSGGVDRPVIGAHAYGFNTDSAGVAVLGTFTNVAPPQAALDTVAKVAAWKLGLDGGDPTGSTTLTEGVKDGNFTYGSQVPFKTISGHRDANSTACPGLLYDKLSTIRTAAKQWSTPADLTAVSLTGATKVNTTYYTKGTVTLGWHPAAATGYRLLDNGTAIAHPTASATSVTATLRSGTHQLQVIADNIDGTTAKSSAFSVVADATRPVFSSSAALSVRTGTVSSTKIPVSLTWKATDDRLLRSVKATSPAAVTFTPTTTAWSAYAKPATSTAWSLTATDAAGNTATSSATRTASLRSDSSSSRTGTWKTTTNSHYLGGTGIYSSAKGATASWTVTARSVALIDKRATTAGKYYVYVDGTYVATVDTKASSSLYRQIQWTRTWSSSSRHTIKIKVAGTSGRPTIALDGLAYIG
ncbi:N-acetylmuramoyl-L-alanine amidase [Actinoallomurus soli]|uniref:N-acetylmuramoyl-L-alanine amidase n=1 Tax=Actinoallomurus soli TaxID=2952535 RepID=UPI002092DE3E|nr:N-acetylmuramoyl-L-alanine amidase [Actinoallomurus soli]MCO5969125.1 N-acetylmuramoyl-L-alanine amidase [Actinoallomurus soli]